MVVTMTPGSSVKVPLSLLSFCMIPRLLLTMLMPHEAVVVKESLRYLHAVRVDAVAPPFTISPHVADVVNFIASPHKLSASQHGGGILCVKGENFRRVVFPVDNQNKLLEQHRIQVCNWKLWRNELFLSVACFRNL